MTRRRNAGEGSIYRDATRGGWVGQVWIDGRRRKVRGKTKADVTAQVAKLIHGDPAEAAVDRRIRLGTLLAEWQDTLDGRRLAPSTREAHRWGVALLTSELGTVRAASLDVRAVEAAFRRLARGSQGKNLSRASLVKVRSTLRQALAWAERRQVVARNVAAIAELPGGLPAPEERRSLTAEQLRALFAAAAEHELHALYVVMGSTALRPGEAAGLCADAVDVDLGVVTVRRAVQVAAGRPVLVDELKTAASYRAVALPPVALDALRRRIADRPDGLLFTAPDGGPLWHSTVRAELVKLCDAAGVPRIRPNELRHSAATVMADAGLPLHQVADVLGHTTTRMLDQTYRHRPPVVRGPELLTAWQ